MFRIPAIFLTVAALVLIAGCPRSPESAAGFRLPDGDPAMGRSTFVEMQCYQCHTIKGEEFPVIPNTDPPYVLLGGKVTRVRTYGELVTSVINPSHKISPAYAEELVSTDGVSKMYIYNDIMTVTQLTDLVAYLQSQYDVVVPQGRYHVYP
ncbi:MAG: c-type cytochrome [Pseudomonadota bacterium]